MIKILSSLVVLFSIASLSAQDTQTTPKLVVGITIDQLRGDYLEMFQHTFGEKGFKKLLNEGLVYADLEFNFPYLDRASTITTIFTGANPAYHGIIGENKFILNENREVSSFFDNNYSGSFTTDRYSPLPVKVSTIADELKIASGGQSDVFAFAPHASQALVSGGHAASGAFWVEDLTGNWATSAYYKTRQPIVEQHNRAPEALNRKIGSITWRPAIDISNYKAFPYTKNLYNFQHYFGVEKKNHVRLLKQSPYVNTEIREIAEKVLKSSSLGKRQNPDFLALTFYAGNFENSLDKNYSVEIQDTYYRLDQEIGKLLDAIDSAVGLQNALIFVASTGYFNEQEIHPSDMVISGGDFYPDRSIALLNMYLMAIYGREQWISKYYNQQLFFNRKLIEDRKINFVEFQQKAAEFLVQSSGIQDVITSHQMLHGAYNQNVQHYRNGFYKGISGDLYLELQPGWKVVFENDPNNNARVRDNAVHAPVIFFGNNIKPQKIYRVIDATEIAPSVSHRLRVRAPNAAKANILEELF
ncbi:MAG: alkaline phosphatase family protein [Bacteroidia bacterium]|nr:alkaline phosphatase family protein [Bacteroidia bacterium]